jgi:hypothetical protein
VWCLCGENDPLFWLFVVFVWCFSLSNDPLFWLFVVFFKNDQKRLEPLVLENSRRFLQKFVVFFLLEKNFFLISFTLKYILKGPQKG